MKLKIYISISLFIFILSACNITNNKSIQYQKKILILNSTSVDSDLGRLFDFYYEEIQSYPETIKELVDFCETEYSQVYLKQLLIDPYRGSEDTLAYFPIYDRLTQKPVSYIFLSTAEDQRFNNDRQQLLYSDDWAKKIKAYNLQDIINEFNKTVIDYPYKDRKRAYISVCIKDEYIKSGKVAVSGDSILSRETIYSQFPEGMGAFNYVFYPEYSPKRENGDSDLIVACSRKRIKYTISR